MSHVAEMKVSILDLDALEVAGRNLGLELVRDVDRYRWYGTHVGDYPLPEGFTRDDLGHCEHVLRIPNDSRAYEIGICKRRDGKPGYVLLWDFWAGGYGLVERVGQNGNRLVREYQTEVATKTLRRQGYRVTTQTQEDGSVRIRAFSS